MSKSFALIESVACTGIVLCCFLWPQPVRAQQVDQYFIEIFDGLPAGSDLQSSHLLPTDAYHDSGGARVYDDIGGRGVTPAVAIFGSGSQFLNINKDLVATTSAFSSGYEITADVSFVDGYQGESGKGVFSAADDTVALQIMLRMSGPSAWDGLALRFFTNGNVVLFTSEGEPGSRFTEIGRLSNAFPNLHAGPHKVKVVDASGEISIFADDTLIGSFPNIAAGAAGSSYLAIGTAGQFYGTKFKRIEVGSASAKK